MSYRVSNLGGTFPRFFVLRMVDMFTQATCVPPAEVPKGTLKGALITQPFSCALEAEKQRCLDGGGSCVVGQDGESSRDRSDMNWMLTIPGYYIVNVICVVLGVLTFWSFIRPQALKLQKLPLRAWRLPEGS